jgi:hypothetical protein
MKKVVLIVFVALFALSSANAAKKIKISVVPENAKIYVDGNYIGDGNVTSIVTGDFISLKFECPGYVTINTKFYRKDKRNAISYTMTEDTFYASSSESDIVNNYFTVIVDPKYYSINDDGTKDVTLAWKMIHQILLNYFDEIQNSDPLSGFIQTPWVYQLFPESQVQIRTRVMISEGGGSVSDLVYRIKIYSEKGSIMAAHRDEYFKSCDRLLKKYESLIQEFQARLGKQN